MEQPLPRLSEMRQQPDSGPSRPPATEGKKLEGQTAPDFSLPTLDGGTMTLADYRGKVVLLNFWATWCPPCKEEMPSMQKLYEHFKGRDFVMLTVSIDDKTGDVAPFMKELGLTFPVAFDPGAKVGADYGLTGVPETFLIDKRGTVMHHLIGPGDWYQPGLVSAFESLVDRPVAAPGA
ncbi:MAG: TlpA family protein disulfide reductase [Nitrospinae bacterium]|nr:TlpA family protein disulfide reductase [Nitrospinota bacterium]